MRIRKESVTEDGLDIEADIPPDGLDIAVGDDVLGCRQLHVTAHVLRQVEDLVVQGRLTGQVIVPCARCLEPAVIDVDADFDMLFAARMPSQPEQQTDSDLTDAEDDLESIEFYDGYELDLTNLLRDYVLTSIPLKPLCKPKCRGLCPACGTNLNESTCSCSLQPGDSRFAALQNWKPKSSA